jgi:5,5'-dehydrodivanillate O-demethylase oxygenase subunit
MPMAQAGTPLRSVGPRNRSPYFPSASSDVAYADVEKTGPDGLGGQYLRKFWQPVFHSHDLPVGRALPLRALNEEFTIYRGQSGTAHIVGSRCPHRTTPLHIGWVQGDEIRCFYHGWKFDGAGNCTEQPAERPSFCDQIKLAAYPTREYIGLIFGYFGEGEPPEFPRFPAFEGDDVVLTYDSYERPCTYFNNLENVGDFAHIPFTHSTLSGAWDESNAAPNIVATESDWGITMRNVFPDGRELVTQFGMPNIVHVKALPDDPDVPFREFLAWWVPITDRRHTQVTVVRTPRVPGATERYLQRRAERFAGYDLDPEQVARDIMAGKLNYADVDPRRVWMVVLQDHLAQIGVGMPSERPTECLGRSDAAVLLQRRLWARELGKMVRGEPLKQWRYNADTLPVKATFR